MRHLGVVVIAFLAMGAGQAQAVDVRALKLAPSVCKTGGRDALRVAFHPGQVPLRCARFLPTTRLPHGAPPLHT